MKRKDREQDLAKILAAWKVEMVTDDLEDMMAQALDPEELLGLNGLAARSLLFAGWDLGILGR